MDELQRQPNEYEARLVLPRAFFESLHRQLLLDHEEVRKVALELGVELKRLESGDYVVVQKYSKIQRPILFRHDTERRFGKRQNGEIEALSGLLESSGDSEGSPPPPSSPPSLGVDEIIQSVEKLTKIANKATLGAPRIEGEGDRVSEKGPRCVICGCPVS